MPHQRLDQESSKTGSFSVSLAEICII